MTKLQRTLRVFLCHSSNDKPIIRDLYWRLRSDGLDPWLDEENLLPGQDWNAEIEKAVRAVDVVIVCLSKESVSKTGFVQKEIKFALDVADEQPDDTIFLIPLKLEECNVPERLRRWHWVNLFDNKGYERLMKALHRRAESLGLSLRSNDIVKLGEYRPSHLAAAILQAESFLRSDLIRLGIHLEIAVDPRIFVDVSLNALTYALANILSNAKNAVGKGGIIRIESEDAGEMIYCRVIDNGPGIPPEIRDRILKGFINTKQGHYGVGLLLVSTLLQANGGTIEVTSTGPDGTCVTLYLPKFEGDAAPNNGMHPTPPHGVSHVR